MAETVLLRIGDQRRAKAEIFIRTVYATQYEADIDAFPFPLFVLVDDRSAILCAAGVRSAEDGFFSEFYLDAPIEATLSAISGRTIARSEVLEVCTLASSAPQLTGKFINAIVAFGEANGFAWSFFTLTNRLRNMVEKLGLAPIFLANADRNRISDFERWGTYYSDDPKVYAVASASLARSFATGQRIVSYANAV
jgi:hypothetical protein